MLTRTIVFNDVHAPFHDTKALSLVLDVAEDIQVDRIVINGDLLDFYDINSHGAKHPDIMQKLDNEIDWGIEFFQNLRKRFKEQEIVFIFGNHEYRLDRFIMNNCPAFWNIIKLEKMLRLDELNIEWHQYNDYIRLENTNLFVQHSPPSYGVNGARTSLLKKMDCNYIWGCTHREQHCAITGASGETYRAWFNGWLGSTTASKEHKRVFSYAKGHQNWQQCFSIVNIYKGKEFHVTQVPIKNNRCFVDGALYEAS